MADLYSNGRSEEILGKALVTYNIPREDVVIMTKCRWGISRENEPQLNLFASTVNDGRIVNRVGLSRKLSRKHIFDTVQASVKRLGTYIDVLQIHRMDPNVPHKEIMKALNDVVENGWARYIGVNSMPAWEFQMLQSVVEKNGWHNFISMQNIYNLIYREEEREMLPYCWRRVLGAYLGLRMRVEFWPILGPPLGETPTLRAEEDLLVKRIVAGQKPATKAVVDAVESIAKVRGVPMVVIATAWCLSKESVNPIAGLNNIECIGEIASAVKVVLTKEEIEELEKTYLPSPVVGY